ncbi:MAG: hypothetical protein LBT39_02150, partial [Treponema sp.]|nr:hypothetical protein [Treponema sp.]
MVYKQKLGILTALAAALALIYAATMVFDPERSGRRSDAYTWLDPRLRDSIDRIDIKGPPEAGAIRLVRRLNEWMVSP